MWIAHVTLPLTLAGVFGLSRFWTLFGSLFPNVDYIKYHDIWGHSILWLIPAYFLVPDFTSFAVGFLTHIPLDALDEGRPWLFPLSMKKFFALKLWKNYYWATGSLVGDFKGVTSDRNFLLCEAIVLAFCLLIKSFFLS